MELPEGMPAAAQTRPAPLATRKGEMDIQAILEILPHRYPILLVDRVLEIEINRRIVARKNVSANEPYFAGHFPNIPVMPGVLIIEGMAQAAAILALLSEPHSAAGKITNLVAMDRCRFRRPVRPGDQMEYEIVMLRRHEMAGNVLWRIRGTARVDGAVVCEAELTAGFVAPGEWLTGGLEPLEVKSR